MVDRGLAFLSDNPASLSQAPSGAAILVGYTVLKATGDDTHPKVTAAIQTAHRLALSLDDLRAGGDSKIVYEASMAAILLATVDSVKHSQDLGRILYWLEEVQKNHGGFGYLDRGTGDTSQVQYAMLALWTMDQSGIDVPVNIVEKTLKYLRATMDPTGGWGYQGVLGDGKFVAQDKVTRSLATAGIGALIIGGDILGFYGARKKTDEEVDGVPSAFKRVDLIAQERARRRELTMSRSDTDGVLDRAIRFQNSTNERVSNWYYYWRYSQERYESFLEIVQGKQQKSPDWYNEGVRELAGAQEDDGSWGKTKLRSISTTASVDTSFAILFLIRSTQKAIGKIDEGVTFGGYSLPSDIGNIKMVGNRIVSDAEASVDSLLQMLEDDSENVQIGLLPETLQLSGDPAVRRDQITRLSRLIASEDFKARRIAAKLLGRSEDLDQVPDLIFALSDDDPEVPVIAEESLRLLSRKLKSGSLTTSSTPEEKASAVKFWREWYLGVRPDYVFVDE